MPAQITNTFLAEATAHLSKAVGLAPRFAEARASLGYCLLRARQVDEGIAEIRQAQELGLVSAKTHLNLSYAFLLKNLPGEAAEEARRAIGLDPALAQAYNNLGIACTKQGLTREAEGAFGKAAELDPLCKDAFANLAGLLTALGRRREALGNYLKALAIDPKDGVLHNNIAVLYFKEGSFDKALDHARKAMDLGVKVDPGFLDELKKIRSRFSADLLQLAVAGHLGIHRDDGFLKKNWWLERLSPTAAAPPADAEKVLEGLFASGPKVELKDSNARLLSGVRSRHESAMSRHYEPRWFNRFGSSVMVAIGIAVASIALAMMISGGAAMLAILVVAAVMVPVLLVFAVLLKAPTPEGRRLLDEIEGLRLYLGVAEREDLARLQGPGTPPLLDAARYERLLPYAVALGPAPTAAPISSW